MQDKIRIQLCFTEEVDIRGQKINYSDALYFEPDMYASLDATKLQAIKDERVANWKDRILNPPPEVEPTNEMLEAESASLAEQKLQIETRYAELQEKITQMSVKPTKEI